jgi:hypothetical protein
MGTRRSRNDRSKYLFFAADLYPLRMLGTLLLAIRQVTRGLPEWAVKHGRSMGWAIPTRGERIVNAAKECWMGWKLETMRERYLHATTVRNPGSSDQRQDSHP